MDISLCRLLPVAAYLWNHHTKGYRGVYMFPQNYVKLKDAVASPQIKNLDIQRLVVTVCAYYVLRLTLRFKVCSMMTYDKDALMSLKLRNVY